MIIKLKVIYGEEVSDNLYQVIEELTDREVEDLEVKEKKDMDYCGYSIIEVKEQRDDDYICHLYRG